MGVPVLTLAGTIFLSRRGVGLLTTPGLSERIAADAGDYVARVVSYVRDLHRLASLRSRLRKQVLSSPTFDPALLADHFATALRGMWQAWCRQQRLRQARLMTARGHGASIPADSNLPARTSMQWLGRKDSNPRMPESKSENTRKPA
jgi:hypothetical protein